MGSHTQSWLTIYPDDSSWCDRNICSRNLQEVHFFCRQFFDRWCVSSEIGSVGILYKKKCHGCIIRKSSEKRWLCPFDTLTFCIESTMPNTAVDPASTSIGSISIHLMVSLTDRIAPQLTHGNAERSSKLRPPLQLLVDAGTLRALLHKEAGKQLRFSSSSIFVVLGLLHGTYTTNRLASSSSSLLWRQLPTYCRYLVRRPFEPGNL